MLYLVAYQNKGKNLLKLQLDDGTEKWASTSEAVYNYAKSNLKAKDEVDVEMTKTNGQINVTRINKKGEKVSEPVISKTEGTNAPYTCIDCGKVLKDGKYQKCFECNKKNPVKKEGKKEVTGNVGRSIEKQAMMKASAMAVGSTFVGQIPDAGVLADMIIVVYRKLLEELTK
jgi:uncharacterized protein YabE (DUF348 family)